MSRIDSENVVFGGLVATFVAITLIMGTLLYSAPEYDPDKTLKILMPVADDYTLAQEKFTAAYKRIHPDIHVELMLFTHRDVWQKLEFLMVAGIPPDVSNIQQPNLPRFVHLGVLEPLDEWIRNDPGFELDKIHPRILDEGNWNGLQYALPSQVSTVVLWYNKRLFDREGVPYPTRDWTLDDMLVAARKLTKDFDGDGFTDQFGFFCDQQHWNRYPAFVWMRGGEFFAEDQVTCTFDDPKVFGAIQWLADLALKEKVMPSMTFLDAMNQVNLFLSDRLAMSAQTRFFMASVLSGKNADKMGRFDIDVCELPRDERRATTMILEEWIVPNGISDQRKRMAMDYLKFLTGEAGQNAVAEIGIALPVRLDVAERMVTHPGRPPENDRAFLDCMGYGRYFYRPTPVEAAFAQGRSDLGAVYMGRRSAEEVCTKIAQRCNKALKEHLERYPDDKIPVRTRWIPFDQRGGGQPGTEGIASPVNAGAFPQP